MERLKDEKKTQKVKNRRREGEGEMRLNMVQRNEKERLVKKRTS